MSRGGFSAKTKRVIVDRQDGACGVCGVMCIDPLDYRPLREHSFQHRRARAMGGSCDPVTSSPANGLLVCGSATTGDHQRIEAHPAWAAGRGFRVSSWDDPAEVSVVVFGYGRVRLAADGGYVPVGQDGAA